MPHYTDFKEGLKVIAAVSGIELTGTTTGALGYSVLPLVGLSSTTAALGAGAGLSILSIGLSCFVAIPLAYCLIDMLVISNPLALGGMNKNYKFCLDVIISMGSILASLALSAFILGIAVNPVVLCMVAGTITLGVGLIALGALFYGVKQVKSCLEKSEATPLKEFSMFKTPVETSIETSSDVLAAGSSVTYSMNDID